MARFLSSTKALQIHSHPTTPFKAALSKQLARARTGVRGAPGRWAAGGGPGGVQAGQGRPAARGRSGRLRDPRAAARGGAGGDRAPRAVDAVGLPIRPAPARPPRRGGGAGRRGGGRGQRGGEATACPPTTPLSPSVSFPPDPARPPVNPLPPAAAAPAGTSRWRPL